MEESDGVVQMEEEKLDIWALPFETTLSSVHVVKDKTRRCPSFVEVLVYYNRQIKRELILI